MNSSRIRDPLNFSIDHIRKGVSSFNSDRPLHPLLQSYLYGQESKDQIFHSLGNSIRGQDLGPLCDAFLGLHLFMGGINSRTGFTSTENNFCVLAPIVLFEGKQKFTCRFLNYPTFTAGPITVRSNAACLPAESWDVSFSVDMFGMKIAIEPEANLLCTPESRLAEYIRKKEQVEKSINQTMQDQITHALANCPTLTMARLRNDHPNISRLCDMPETLKDFVYSEIQRESMDFCSWTLNAISPQGALQDAYTSLLLESKSGQRPNYVVTTPEIADFIADSNGYKTPSSDVLYTISFSDDKGTFVPGNIVPYHGVSKQVSLTTSSINVSGVTLPILQVPHLNRESNSTYNMFEHGESFWTFNELGYLSGLNNAKVADFKPVVRSSIRVTDLQKGRDGKFSMDECLRSGGGLLPETYDRYKYDEMLRGVPGLLDFLKKKTNSVGLLNLIGKKLPLNSPYTYYFPSPKVRYCPVENQRSNFRSTGIFGNRPSFDNWHPPIGDVEASKDWLANKVHINENDLNELEVYLRKCAEISWSGKDFKMMKRIDQEFETTTNLASTSLQDESVAYLLKDLIECQGYSRFAGIPRYFDALATLASRAMQQANLAAALNMGEDNGLLPEYLSKIVTARAAIFRVASRLTGLFPRVDTPDGVLTDCPSSIPVYDVIEDLQDAVSHNDSCSRDTKAAYRFYSLCIVPLVFEHIYTMQDEDDHVEFLNFRLANQCRKNVYTQSEETFQQPYFKRGFPSNVQLSEFESAIHSHKKDYDGNDDKLLEVTAYDPLFKFDVEVIRDDSYSRHRNFFDHFVSHRFDYLRKTSDEPFFVRVMAAFLNMIRYTPSIEKEIGHKCLLNRKYRVIRQCNMTVGMVGLYAGGKDNMMYAVGNMSTVTNATANNGIDITTRVNGNCFIVDPLSSGRVIHNAVSKNLNSGMTSTLLDVSQHLARDGKFTLPSHWWKNTGFVVEALPGCHPLLDQHHFIPLNGRHLRENYNSAGFDLTEIDIVGNLPGGWYTENPYATRNYSEAHLIYGELFPRHKVPLYDSESISHGIDNIHKRATIERKEMAGKVVEKINATPLYSSFSGRSNIGFLERQYIDARASHCRSSGSSEAVSDMNDSWQSKSPLKENSNSETRFSEALRLNSRRTDAGISVMADAYGINNIESRPLRTGVKGRYTTETTK